MISSLIEWKHIRVTDSFFDSNVLLYLLSGDHAKADQAERLIRQGGHISVQVLNEFSSIATRKLKMRHHEVREVLAPIRELCKVNPLTEDCHDLGFKISENYQLSVYDSMIVASSLIAGCETLLSEDMQDGLFIENKLRIRNPFH